MRPAVISPAEAAALIGNGQTVGFDGFTLMGVADDIYQAIAQSFAERGAPRELTVFHTSGQSNREIGLERFAVPGLVKRIIGSHWGLAPKLGTLINENGMEGICLPQGQLSGLVQAIAAGRPGNLSRVGLGTFVDPRLEGGRINARAVEATDPSEFVERVTIGGEEVLLYKSLPLDVAVFRATRVDRRGNASQSGEAAGLDALAFAQAARNSGGIVICQVAEFVEDGEILARDVTVPANLIDYLVPTSDRAAHHREVDSVVSDPSLTSGVIDEDALAAVLAGRSVAEDRMSIGRRGARLVRPGDVINVGTGIPGDTIGVAVAERGLMHEVTMSIESGVYNGIPMGGTDFGAAQYPSAIVSHSAQFDFYTGGGVDIAFMGVGQVSPDGNVNVSKLGGRMIGCGGFIDILSGAKRICFLMSGRGRYPKFTDRVDQLTFNGQQALLGGQEVFLATEEYLLRLTPEGWVVDEVDDTDAARELVASLPLAGR